MKFSSTSIHRLAAELGQTAAAEVVVEAWNRHVYPGDEVSIEQLPTRSRHLPGCVQERARVHIDRPLVRVAHREFGALCPEILIAGLESRHRDAIAATADRLADERVTAARRAATKQTKPKKGASRNDRQNRL